MATQPSTACRTLPQKGTESLYHRASHNVVPTRLVDHGADAVRECLLLANMLPKERQQVVQAAQARRFSKGEIIHRQGEPVQQFLLLSSGYAKLSQLCPDGNEVIVRLCGPGEILGPIPRPTHGLVHSATAQALQPCEALIWLRGPFDLLCRRFPRLELNGLLILEAHLREMEERFREISTQEVPYRLSRQLLRLLNQVGSREGGVIPVRISQEELAQLIGATLYTVSRVLARWERRGIVRTRREEISIQNANELQSLCEGVCS